MKGRKTKVKKPQIKDYQADNEKPEIIYLNGQYYTPIIVNKDLPALASATVLWSENFNDRLPKNNKPTK